MSAPNLTAHCVIGYHDRCMVWVRWREVGHDPDPFMSPCRCDCHREKP